MGHKDIENLFMIYEEIKRLNKKYDLDFHFKIDEGNFETAIEFFYDNDEKWHSVHPPTSKDWSNNPTILCPDLLDYHNRIAIEFEEEVGNPRTGARLARKGHHREGDLPNNRDLRRNELYKKTNLKCFQLWKSDKDWKLKLKGLLIAHLHVQ